VHPAARAESSAERDEQVSYIHKVISGGQTGVDIASLRAAKARGYPTGGTMPAGFRTLLGPMPGWAAEFGLDEHASDAYPARTYQNVRDAGVTVRIAVDFETAGERCTAKACAQYRKPPIDVPVRRTTGGYVVDESDIFAAAEKIRSLAEMYGGPIIVNFAGNSERTARGIEALAEAVVKMLLDAVDG
jgi:hypothetical protein